jgi:hypothetical protein
MAGKPTELVVNQHVLIYAWLSYQYQNQVETRFVLHDTEAREVENFQAYYSMQVAGGTQVASAYRLVNEIVAQEELTATTPSMSFTVPTATTGTPTARNPCPSWRRCWSMPAGSASPLPKTVWRVPVAARWRGI